MTVNRYDVLLMVNKNWDIDGDDVFIDGWRIWGIVDGWRIWGIVEGDDTLLIVNRDDARLKV